MFVVPGYGSGRIPRDDVVINVACAILDVRFAQNYIRLTELGDHMRIINSIRSDIEFVLPRPSDDASA